MSFHLSTGATSADIREICCIGAGFVGGSTGAVLAAQLPHINVTVVDLNQARINAWNSDILPIWEPGLDDLVKSTRSLDLSHNFQDARHATNTTTSYPHDDDNSIGGNSDRTPNLWFTTNVDDSIRKSDMIFVCVDTPSASQSKLLGQPLCTKTLRKAVEQVARVAVKDFILVEKCTVPCGTAKDVANVLKESVRPGVNFEVLSNPEFLAEGTAVRDLLNPDRVLIGSSPTATGMTAAHTLAGLYERWVPSNKIFTIDTWSAELSKLAANAMLAQRISSINSLSAICESIDADIRTVSKTCSLDERIGPHMLNASVGFGGSCFHKDISYVVYLAASLGLDQVARYWQAVLDMNEYQQNRFADRVKQSLRSLKSHESKIAVLGFAFKAKTNDTRNSAAIQIARELIAVGFNLAIYDPCVSEVDIRNSIQGASDTPLDRVTISATADEACFGAHAAIVLTEWDAFRYPPRSSMPVTKAMFDEGPPTPESLDSPQLLSRNGLGSRSASDSDISTASNIVEEQEWSSEAPSEVDVESNSVGIMGLVQEQQQQHQRKQSKLSGTAVSGSIQWHQIANLMLEPKQLFDGRNIIGDDIVDLGFRIERIGKMSSHVY